jgi:hypothetical protein
MKARTAIVLIVLGAASLAAAVTLRPADDSPPGGAGMPVFPSIATVLPQATTVAIRSGDKSSTIVLKNGTWGLAERDGYPITEPKLRELLAGLTELRLTEPRTADPAQFSRLGVEDPTAKGTTATEMKVSDASGKVMADLIFGHRRVRSQGGLPEAVYVRKPGDNQSWLAEGRVPADADPQSWMVRDIADIPRTSIVHVVVQRGADTLDFARTGDTFALTTPTDLKLDDYRVEEVSGALSGLTMTDVKAGDLPGTKLGTSVFTTKEGLTITVTLSKDGKLLWGSFVPGGTGAESWSKLKGWAYQLSDWRENSLMPKLEDLKSTEPEKPASPAAPATPAAPTAPVAPAAPAAPPK